MRLAQSGLCLMCYGGLGTLLLLTGKAQAQWVVPDRSLGTIVNSTNNRDFVITGGGTAGRNLFHSFHQFSIPTGGSAIFDNAAAIQTIFSRVTGRNVSSIDGLLQTNGHADLFLLNPNGILFGPNAQLNLGGSLFATTASAIGFADGNMLNATDPVPLLSLSVPIGLQMGQNPGAITVQGKGHQLNTQNPILAPYVPVGFASGLGVRSGQTIALVGGDLALAAGVLTAPEGRVDLASLGPNATISLTPTGQLGAVIGDRRDMQFSQKSLVDVNGIGAGSIQVQGRSIDFQTGSLLWAQNRGPQASGDITVNATDRLRLDGMAPDFSSVSSIINESLGGNGGNIHLHAPQLTVTNGGNIMSRAFGVGKGGDLTVQSTNLEIAGFVPLAPGLFSNINAYAAGAAPGGNLNVMAQTVALLSGGTLGATTAGSGNGGAVNITADIIRINGVTPNFFASTISVPELGGTGNAGNLTVNTRQLSMAEGGAISAASFGPGKAGQITINATESIELAGSPQLRQLPYQTNIASAVAPPIEPYKSLFNLTAAPSGSSGDLTINTPNLRLYDGAIISVEHLGSGIAGNMNVNADRISIKNGSYIVASSISGQGGDLRIQASTLLLNQTSRISTTAGGSGDGGNIRLNVPLIVGVNNSDITANAFQGMGGKIQITTQGLLGLKFRPKITPENDITASSQFGVNGTVQVNTIGVDPNSGLVALPIDIIDPNQTIATDCSSDQSGSFVVTGRGGVPENPTQKLSSDRVWQDLRAIAGGDAAPSFATTRTIHASALLEATTWLLNAQGQPELIAEHRIEPHPPAVICTR